MENKFKQPDLFLVMSASEMDDALSYAEELIGENEKCIEMYLNFSIDNNIGQYKLSINNVDVRDYILDENNNYKFEFPMMPYYCLIFFENEGKRDSIALAIPVSVWPEAYDIEYLKSFFVKHNFKIIDHMHNIFLSEEFATTIYPEALQAESKQIDSPWTIRDKDTLKGALNPNGDASAIGDVDEVDSIVLIRNANITLDFNATAIVSTRFDTKKIDFSTFYFPNSLVIYTKEGKKTPIYIGNDVSYEDIMEIIKENGLSKFLVNKELDDYLENIDDLIVELMPFARFKDNAEKKSLL